MLQHATVQSPARLGLSNPTSPALQNTTPTPPKFPSSQTPPQAHLHQQYYHSGPTSSSLISLLPPLPRAQSILLQMASLATKLFEVSPNRPNWISAFRGSLPTFLSSHTPTQSAHEPSSFSLSSSKEILSQFNTLQSQLFEAVAELQEILDLQDAKVKLSRDIRSKDAAMFAFANKLKDAERVLDELVDDYSDYRRPKRGKLDDDDDDDVHNDTVDGEDSSCRTTVSTQLKLSDILSYAHTISYTTFAPPEFGANQAPLRGALPPAPQDEHLRASQLYNFADLDIGLPKTVEMKEKTIEPLIEPPPPPSDTNKLPVMQGLLPPNITVPSGWKPGMPVELPMDLASIMPPAGWKPGDPVPLPPLDSLPMPPRMPDQPARPQGLQRHTEPIQVRHVQLDILGQDDDSSDYTSEEGSSEDED